MKPAIPAVRTGTTDLDLAQAAIKQTLDSITGQARGSERLEPLPSTASLADVINRLNEILNRMQ